MNLNFYTLLKKVTKVTCCIYIVYLRAIFFLKKNYFAVEHINSNFLLNNEKNN